MMNEIMNFLTILAWLVLAVVGIKQGLLMLERHYNRALLDVMKDLGYDYFARESLKNAIAAAVSILYLAVK